MAKRPGFHSGNRSSILRGDTTRLGNAGRPELSLAKTAAWERYPPFPLITDVWPRGKGIRLQPEDPQFDSGYVLDTYFAG